jgi:hypothetical protein
MAHNIIAIISNGFLKASDSFSTLSSFFKTFFFLYKNIVYQGKTNHAQVSLASAHIMTRPTSCARGISSLPTALEIEAVRCPGSGHFLTISRWYGRA